MTDIEQQADLEARHGNREALEAMTAENERLRAELAAQIGTTWDDREDDLTAEAHADHPVTRRENWPHYHKAQEAVSNRHSKGSLIGLVTHLMAKQVRTEADLAAAREQVAGAYLAAENVCVEYSMDNGTGMFEEHSAECGDIINSLTPADATAALEARDARVRAEAFGPASQLIADAWAEAQKAMRKFPQPNYVISKEAGEVVKAAIHCAEGRETKENVTSEIKQAIAMLMRLYIEGDQVHGLDALRDPVNGGE